MDVHSLRLSCSLTLCANPLQTCHAFIIFFSRGFARGSSKQRCRARTPDRRIVRRCTAALQLKSYRRRPGRAGRANLTSDSGLIGVDVPLAFALAACDSAAARPAPWPADVAAAVAARVPSSESIHSGVISAGSDVSSWLNRGRNRRQQEGFFFPTCCENVNAGLTFLMMESPVHSGTARLQKIKTADEYSNRLLTGDEGGHEYTRTRPAACR